MDSAQCLKTRTGFQPVGIPGSLRCPQYSLGILGTEALGGSWNKSVSATSPRFLQKLRLAALSGWRVQRCVLEGLC